MSDTDRTQGVVSFGAGVEPGPLRDALTLLTATLHRITSVAEFTLICDTVGVTFTNAATTPGTANTKTRDSIDFVDAGIDQVRIVVRGNNSAVGTVAVSVYDVTDSVELCTVTMSGVTETTYTGSWTSITPTGGDHEVETRVIGNGAFDPICYRVAMQARTLQARA